MTDRELKKLSRTQLLEMLLAQSREVAKLRAELQTAQQALENRKIQMEEAGNIAVAALKMNGVFEAAQAAAEQYLQNVSELMEDTRERCRLMEENTRRNCEELILAAQTEAASYWDIIREKIRDPFLENESWQEILAILEEKPSNLSKVEQ